MLKKKKVDLRVLRTKKMISEAFVELFGEKGYDQITIQDIADRAMINRATFYLHFKDKNDLLDQIFEFALASFSKILDPSIIQKGNQLQIKKLEAVIAEVFIEIKKNKTFYQVLTESNYINKMKEQVAKHIQVQYQHIFSQLKVTENDFEVPIDFIIEYMTAIFVSTVHWWLMSDSNYPPEQMAHLLIKLVGNGHLTVLGLEVIY
ncbi:TetR/AcrR family transcriptional regulator [Isobaculum melis]|uniref:DNA-binding transcriptional regulator, AcrR family n=1 Tax=Isobaculum melis TaxID=142588 RepID=A0A1H9QQA6_9LACT|nr:TetR/AcrR family transcriptional regulator [Isobaculum melis]SER62019.1 DNA-binding transcriptional regulator, AcrR family [Isobaculum melis]